MMTTKSLENIEEFLSFTEKDAVDLAAIADFVKRNCNSAIPLVKPKGSTLRICGQDGTLYEGDEEQLEAWKDYYLPERLEMEVIGAIDDFPCDAFGLQLVLLLGEDGRVYAYEDELLHLVAKNLKNLIQCGMVFPGMETFKLGECFEEPTEEEYHEMMECDEITEMKRVHMEFRESLERDLLNTMNDITQSRDDHLKKQVCSEDMSSSRKQKPHFPQNNSKMQNGRNSCHELSLQKKSHTGSSLLFVGEPVHLVPSIPLQVLPKRHTATIQLLHHLETVLGRTSLKDKFITFVIYWMLHRQNNCDEDQLRRIVAEILYLIENGGISSFQQFVKFGDQFGRHPRSIKSGDLHCNL